MSEGQIEYERLCELVSLRGLQKDPIKIYLVHKTIQNHFTINFIPVLLASNANLVPESPGNRIIRLYGASPRVEGKPDNYEGPYRLRRSPLINQPTPFDKDCIGLFFDNYFLAWGFYLRCKEAGKWLAK